MQNARGQPAAAASLSADIGDDDEVEVVTWFHHMIGAKVDRALQGLADATTGDADAVARLLATD